jgi:hypothetical protein
MIHLVHALPNAWLPQPGQYLRTYGLSVEQARKYVSGRAITSHIRYEDLAAKVSEDLGVTVEASGSNCPSPYQGKIILLCVRSPGQTDVQYVRVYDGANEAADHDWRYDMTKYA